MVCSKVGILKNRSGEYRGTFFGGAVFCCAPEYALLVALLVDVSGGTHYSTDSQYCGY